jgi:hypothetical protein
MKTFFAFVLLIFTTVNIFCQDSFLIKRIDSLVIQINTAKLTKVNDSTNKFEDGASMKMYSYSTAFFDGDEFTKFFLKDSIKTNFNGLAIIMNTAQAYYFYKNKLIKVEAYVFESNFKQNMIWYYWDRRLIRKQPAFPVYDKNDESNLEFGDDLLNRYQKRL